MAGVLHLTSPGVAAGRSYQRWAANLPGQQLLGAAEAGPERPGQGLGFHASARTLAKLHAVSPQLFPLPACCKSRSACPEGTPQSEPGRCPSGSNAANHASAVSQEGSCSIDAQTARRENAKAHAARLLMSLDGDVGRPTFISDRACPAALDAGELWRPTTSAS